VGATKFEQGTFGWKVRDRPLVASVRRVHQANLQLIKFLEHVLEEQEEYQEEMRELKKTLMVVGFLRLTLEQMEEAANGSGKGAAEGSGADAEA